jgi:nicotinate-nucleotide pyrophosphorylase (carboxylating)
MKNDLDIRDKIFQKVRRNKYRANIYSESNGIFSGTPLLKKACRTIGISLTKTKKGGDKIKCFDVVAVLEGTAMQLALGEERLIGWISKSSGIATSALKAKIAAGNNLKVVSGAWKKMPFPIKDLVRRAIEDGGIHSRISKKPFIYLDKNYVKILGGIEAALLFVKDWKHFTKIIQLKSTGKRLRQEASVASQLGVHIIMIDTGQKEDIKMVDLVLRQQRLRHKVKIAFGGNIKIEDLKKLRKFPVDIVDIGKAIVDAPLLDMRMDIVRSM